MNRDTNSIAERHGFAQENLVSIVLVNKANSKEAKTFLSAFISAIIAVRVFSFVLLIVKWKKINGGLIFRREREILVNTAKAYPYLNAKHRDAQTNQRKKAAYKAIAAAVSAVGVARWTADECRKKIQVLTSEAKSAAAERERNIRRTGGGPPPAPLTAGSTKQRAGFGAGCELY